MAGMRCETQGLETDLQPQVGDTVHVRGHGPGVLLEVRPPGRRGLRKYKVQYPNGDTYHVEREDILQHEPPRCPSPRGRQAGPSSPSPAQVGPRQVEYLGRSFNDPDRSMGARSAIFSLVATMVGGGVLSLPYAMAQCGLALGTLALFVSGAATFWTLEMLVACARATGLDSFQLVGKVAYGEAGLKVTMWLVFIICWLTLIAYFVLLGDLLVPIAELVPTFQQGDKDILRGAVLAAATLLLSPMCFRSNLAVLRFLTYSSVGSVLFVGMVIGIRSIHPVDDVQVTMPDQQIVKCHASQDGLKWWPQDWLEALHIFPIFGVSFLCHFNALGAHQELQRPTRGRIRRVLALTLAFTALLYLAVGFFGYVYAGPCTCGNILLNFPREDTLVLVGRATLALVLMLNFPLIVQPCRSQFYRILLFAGCCRRPEGAQADDALNMSLQTRSDPPTSLEAPLEEFDLRSQGASTEGDSQLCLNVEPANLQDQRLGDGATAARLQLGGRDPPRRPVSPSARVHVYHRESTRGFRGRNDPPLQAVDSFEPKDETVQRLACEPTTCQRYALTVLLLFTALGVANFMKSIVVVWSVLGSTVAFLIAFILPTLFWLKLVGPQSSVCKQRGAMVMLVIVIVLMIACTVLTCVNLGQPSCPDPTHVAAAAEKMDTRFWALKDEALPGRYQLIS